MFQKLSAILLLLACPLHSDSPTKPLPPVSRSAHLVALNQIGYATPRSKRFTAPLSSDGTPFIVRRADNSKILHRGEIQGNIGDFSTFQPPVSTDRYVIEIRGGEVETGTSDPFLIRPDIWREQYWQPAVDFLIDSRSVIGTHPSAFGGCPWRDGNYYDAIIPSLVMLYLADPARIAAMPRQIDWEADKKRIMDPDFKYDAKNAESGGVMEAARSYYTELDSPLPGAPDVVKLIHWGAGFYLMKPVTKDAMGDPERPQIHSQTVEQIAYVVWAWPALKQWLPQSFYDRCRDFCFANWQKSLTVDKWWDPAGYDAPPTGQNPMSGRLHPYKGRHAPGHSIVPNLLMHEIAKRENRDDAAIYLTAAVAQADFAFGRNPRLAASVHKPEMGFPEIDRGWPIGHKLNVCARLETCRGSISSGPGTEMFPFNPEGAFRHAEGWVNYGASWAISLSYLQMDATGTTPSF